MDHISKSLSRRVLLRGVGVVLATPFLGGLASGSASADAATPPATTALGSSAAVVVDEQE